MIRIHRVTLPSHLADQLRDRAGKLRESQADCPAARAAWKSAATTRTRLTEQLTTMAAGIRRCMYCGDGLGTDIDHFEPLAEAPLRAFDWPNHLLACSHCNSHQKRELFPRDGDGRPLLVDPSAEDPYEHLELVLSTGTYEALTARGDATIKVFGLNRGDLKRGRAAAFIRTVSMLRDHARLRRSDAGEAEATEVALSLLDQPFADVLYAMIRYRDLPGAEHVLRGRDVVTALADPALHFWS
ncbi:HNH endonuclease [Streptosporangium sp. NPDC049644]|uniref:HNH endonuclease n=1 Tax=Streptosporangium sp. NPDC049644 TaxID=3155507 RepID=UPI00341F1976